ncbi:MAG: hypothetical protein ACYS67_06130 [Planctomycetota bacterium]|jgi:uncharacterized protein YxjI
MENFSDNQYMIRRKILTIFGAKFHVYNTEGELILFSKQKAFKLKEDIRVFADESMAAERLVIKARQIVDFSAAYDVVDPSEDRKIGALRRKGWKSLVRDSWEFLDENDQVVAMVEEDNLLLSLIRRFLTNLIPQSYHVKQDERVLITYKQNFNPFVLKIRVNIETDSRDIIDPRLALACGILLAAIEGRQG